MDEESKALAASVPGMCLPSGTMRPFAQLVSILAKLSPDRTSGPIKQLLFLFNERTLEVSGDDEFFTVERIHLKSIEEHPSLEPGWIELTRLADFSHLRGLDLSAVRWELLAGDIDQFVIFEFKKHKQSNGDAEAAVTIKGDDFHLFLFKGAPIFPKLQFDPDRQACRSI